MTKLQQYTAAIHRLTVRAAQLDYDRYLNRINEKRYNRRIIATYKSIGYLQDLLKYLPAFISVYGENEIVRGDIEEFIEFYGLSL